MSGPIHILMVILLFLVQFVISGGIAAFGIVSRMHVDKVFPIDTKGSWCPRLMHRGRLHLILTLIGLELVIVSVIAIWLSLAPGGGGYGRGFW
ncbi:MAG: hypothetical protein KAX38_03610, partial [Candidatus Krumholzibacteria bacterium]|nr:hypothetical protein [Candidatus Krumholzibacteria bacterium]